MEPLWVIVEGPDGAGKSYVAKECAHILASHGGGAPERPCVLQKLSYDSPRIDYIDMPYDLRTTGFHVVQDRGVWSGPVYEPIMRNDIERLAWLDQLVDEALEHNPLVIWVDAHTGVLEDRLERRGDDYITVDKLLDICVGYQAMSERWLEGGGLFTKIETTWDFPDRLQLQMILTSLAAQADRR